MTNMPRATTMSVSMHRGFVLDVYDPGVTTGYCRVEYEEDRSYKVLLSEEIPWEVRQERVHEHMVEHPDAIVVETFRLYSGAAKYMINNTFPSIEFIGIVTHSAWLTGDIPVYGQQAAEIKDKISVLSEHAEVIGLSPHRQDAYCHARLFILLHREA